MVGQCHVRIGGLPVAPKVPCFPVSLFCNDYAAAAPSSADALYNALKLVNETLYTEGRLCTCFFCVGSRGLFTASSGVIEFGRQIKEIRSGEPG